MVILSRNALYSILSLVLLIITGAVFLILLNLEFLAFIIILLYVGAISVLFLFVVMMLQLGKTNSKLLKVSIFSTDGLLYSIFLVKFVFFIFYFNFKLTNLINLFSCSFYTVNYNFYQYSFSNPLLIGGDAMTFLNLFTQKYTFFLLIGIILLFSMVGSIILCLNQSENTGV